jgi:hypothetical protein
MNFLLVLSALETEATIRCATRVRVKTSGLSFQSGFRAPEVRQPQFAPALQPTSTGTRFHPQLWQPATESSQAGRRLSTSPLSATNRVRTFLSINPFAPVMSIGSCIGFGCRGIQGLLERSSETGALLSGESLRSAARPGAIGKWVRLSRCAQVCARKGGDQSNSPQTGGS